jgi:prepilin-type processing-associated H-X9-DG protein
MRECGPTQARSADVSVVESASRLFDLLAATDDTFTRYLGPGLAEDRIREIVAPTGVELPREAVDFYGRFGLPRGYQYSDDQPTLYGIYWLLGLEDAVEQYGAQKRDGLYQSPEEVAAGSAGWFPLLQEDANFYMLNTAYADGHVAGDYEGDPVRVAEIAARFNPGVGLWVVR